MKKLILLVFSFCLALGSASAQENQIDSAQVQDLVRIYYQIETVNDLQTRSILSTEEAAAQIAYYLTAAQAIEPSINSQEALEHILERYSAHPESAINAPSITGFFTFVNIVWFIASLFIVVALGALFALYILPLLRLVPLVVYEMIAHLASIAFMLWGMTFPPATGQFIALLGLLGFSASVSFSFGYHFLRKEIKKQKDGGIGDKYLNEARGIALFLFFISALNAIVYQSSMLGVISVLYLQSAMGFFFFALPLCFFLGFTSKEAMGQAMSISLLLVLIYVAAHVLGWQGTYYDVFAVGIYFWASLVYFLGILITSTRLYNREKPQQWLRLQILALVSFFAALFFGTVWQITPLQNISGTFLFFYLMERYIELVNWRKAWAWALLGLGIFLYVSSLIVTNYPQYFFVWY